MVDAVPATATTGVNRRRREKAVYRDMVGGGS